MCEIAWYRILEGNVSVRIPRQLNAGDSNCLLACHVNGRFPALQRKVTVDLKICADALQHLKIEVVQGCAAGDEIFRGFLIAQTRLYPFVAAQVISDPALSA